jgi:hypothetical protein
MSRERLAFIDVEIAAMIARTYFRMRRRHEPGKGFDTVRGVFRDYLREMLATPAGGSTRPLRASSSASHEAAS